VRYQFIHESLGAYSLIASCRTLRVSRSGYEAWGSRPQASRVQREAVLLGHIRAAHRRSEGTYGSPRIYHDLRTDDICCSRNRIARLMRNHGITARPLRRRVVTTDSEHNLPVAPNLLAQNFVVKQLGTHWSADMTYLWTREGWLYLAVVIDLCSRRAAGWSMDEKMDRSLVIAALRSATAQRGVRPGLICHSDRGSVYASADYQDLLTQIGATCSMSRRGNCYDNAPVESFFATLKRELTHRRSFATRAQARAAVFEWIAVWYNRKRRHSALGYVSPEQFETQFHLKELYDQQQPMERAA
jgi:putative transposase